MGVTQRLCDLCSDVVDVNEHGTYEHVDGYAQRRDGGGLHGLTLRKLIGYAHEDCVHKARKNIPVRQMELW